MSSSFQYNILAGFKVISQIQENIVRNAQGLLTPGYNQKVLHTGGSGSAALTDGIAPSGDFGGTSSQSGTSDNLSITGTTLSFEQGTIDPAFSPTSLAIRGEGFFVLAENMRAGARLFLTRNGDFHYDSLHRLVNAQGLFVVGGSGKTTDPPTPILDPGDGSVVLPQLTLARVPVRSQLSSSPYADTVYQATNDSGPMQFFQNGRPEVGFVQASSLEMPSRVGANAMLTEQVTTALQHYKIFKDMLDNFNKTDDDATSLVK